MPTQKSTALAQVLRTTATTVLILQACTIAGKSTPNVSVPRSDDVTTTAWVTPAAARWVSAMASNFNASRTALANGKVAYVSIETLEGAEALSRVKSGTPDAWISDNMVWPEQANRGNLGDFTAECESIATSPQVIAMHKELAASLGYPARKLGWLDISSLTADVDAWQYYSGGQLGKTLRFAQGHPGLTGSGANTLVSVMQAAAPAGATLDAERLTDPLARASLAAFEGGVAIFSSDPDNLPVTMLERGPAYLGAAAVYESSVLGRAKTAEGLVAIHPFEGAAQATFPFCIGPQSTPEAKEVARLFRATLLASDGQRLAAQNGLRPVSNGVDLPAGAVKQPTTAFTQPSADTFNALTKLWLAARKPVNLVLLIDTSGSMRGDKIDKVRTSAERFVRQMGASDQITVMTFNTTVKTLAQGSISETQATAIAAIQQIEATGNTSLYDSIGEAARVIETTRSSARGNIIVLLSDGKDTSSNRYAMSVELTQLAIRNDTSLYTIGYGEAADNETMRTLATASNGSYYPSGTDDIDRVYQDIASAFGGNAGVGR
jgi:Ca-activated chloride channel homolog